jgi:Na+/H+ antiporter NhaD/arsenite permease-like protein
MRAVVALFILAAVARLPVRAPALGAGIGAVLANLVGTTGASMLLIRPLLRANASRMQKSHIFVFLIFVVSNTGGLLTPLGDPPLFLGFLRGVPFFWTLGLWVKWLVVGVVVYTAVAMLRSAARERTGNG